MILVVDCSISRSKVSNSNLINIIRVSGVHWLRIITYNHSSILRISHSIPLNNTQFYVLVFYITYWYNFIFYLFLLNVLCHVICGIQKSQEKLKMESHKFPPFQCFYKKKQQRATICKNEVGKNDKVMELLYLLIIIIMIVQDLPLPLPLPPFSSCCLGCIYLAVSINFNTSHLYFFFSLHFLIKVIQGIHSTNIYIFYIPQMCNQHCQI